MNTMTRTSLRALLVVAALASLPACKKEAAPEAPAPAAPGAPAPAAPAAGPTGTGVISGSVKLTGTPPVMELTKRQADPFCAKTPMKDEEVVVGAGGALKNVIVRISQGISGHYDPPAAAAMLDQSACMYRPRVQGVMTGQALEIKNSDQTLHNIHGFKGPSTLFNQAEIPGMAPITRKLTETDQVLKFKCDVHPWMTGYVLVSSHPFFAVTGDDGSFKIGNVPPGKYTLEAWHERFGTKTTEVTVADKPVEAAFQYESK
jgi:plastocyanin